MTKTKTAKTPKPLSQQLAEAALKIAAANHYLIGFDLMGAARDVSFDDWSDAYQRLITIENGLERPERDYSSSQRRYRKTVELAFYVLNMACYAQHRVHLNR